jgi:hypothetical protein
VKELVGLLLVKRYFPKISDDEAGFILWNKTGFPCFVDGERGPRKQLSVYRRAVRLKRDVCYCHGKIRHRSEMSKFGDLCKRGEAMMRAKP